MGGNDDDKVAIARLEVRMDQVEDSLIKLANVKQNNITNTIAVVMTITAIFQTFASFYMISETKKEQSKPIGIERQYQGSDK